MMTEQRETYKGREIVIRTENGEPQLIIDGERVMATCDREGDVWGTYRLGYREFASAIDLGKALVDETE